MKIEGKLHKVGRFWAVEIPLLLIYTQGRTKKKSLEMAEDAVEELIEEKGFKAKAAETNNNTFNIGSNNDSLLMALALKQQRLQRGLSIRDVAGRLGSKSPTSYSRYEQGKMKPSLDKFTDLLQAIDVDLEPILKIG